MNRQLGTIALLLPLVVAGCQDGGCATPPTAPPGSPASVPTHHAVVTGAVVGAQGQPLAAISIGGRYAPGCRAADVTGGATTDENGAYRAELQFRSARDEGVVEVYLHALRYGTAGAHLVSDSVRVTLRVVPLSARPVEIRAPTIRLPVE